MPFDPTLPQPNTPADADVIRAQLNALKAITDTQAAQIATLQAQLAALTQQQASDLASTALNPNGNFGNFDPNWQPSGNTTDDDIYLRDRLTDLYNITAR